MLKGSGVEEYAGAAQLAEARLLLRRVTRWKDK